MYVVQILSTSIFWYSPGVQISLTVLYNITKHAPVKLYFIIYSLGLEKNK